MLLRSILLAVAALGLAFIAWRDAAAAYWLEVAPAEAPARFADDPRIALASLDPLLLFGQASRDDALAIGKRARAALTGAPLEASAMSQFALASTLLGGRSLKRQLRLSERLSRRDRVTEAALLSIAASEGDYRATFDHLDKALLVNPDGSQQVFPSLVPLLGDARVRSSLLTYARREWFSAFLAAAATDKAIDPTDVAELMFARGPVPAQERQWLLPHMLGRLVASGHHDMARKMAVRLAGASPSSLDTFAFTAAATDPSLAPLTWMVQSNDIVQARPAAGDSLDIEATPGRVGIIAERTTRLAAGDYALEQKLGALEIGLPPRLEWIVGCKAAGGERVIWQQVLPLSGTAAVYRGSLAVPGDCPEQVWRLKVLVEDQQTSSRFQIGSPALRRTPSAPARAH